MKIAITGSLGHISKPLTETLVQKGHRVTVISSNPEKQKEIEALGAKAAIGTLNDVNFITSAFKDADAVYTMIPPGNYFDHSFDLPGHCSKISNNYAEAIRQSGVKRVVHLSSVGADLKSGAGLLIHHHNVENILNSLPEDISITFMRPTSFYYNLYGFIGTIKSSGFIAANYGGSDVVPWVSPVDIAAAVAEEIEAPFTGRKVRYVVSEELTCDETAAILGKAIGAPDLKWLVISDEQSRQSLEAAGMQPAIAAGLVEMYSSLHNGVFFEDYSNNKPEVIGNVKLADFAKEFAAVFNQK